MKLDSTNWPTWKDEKPSPNAIILLYQKDLCPFLLLVQSDGKLIHMTIDVHFIPHDDDIWIEIPHKVSFSDIPTPHTS